MKRELCCLAVACVSITAALAETPKSTNPTVSSPFRKPTTAPAPYKRDPSEFKYQMLKTAPDLPNMPPWPSAYKLMDSVVNPNARGGHVYQVTFETPDRPEQVMQYYQSMLPVYKWGVVSQTTMTLMAMRKPDIVQVNVMAPSRPKMKCRLLVLYNQNSKARGEQ